MDSSIPFITLQTPIGWLSLGGDAKGIQTLYFHDAEPPGATDAPDPLLLKGKAQLEEYFAGKRKDFDLPLAASGTDFQCRVWNALMGVGFGQTRTYMDIARALQNEKAIRAVGAANGQNPISVIVPCHRIIGSDGKLTGYGGGLWRKEWLLAHERKHTYGAQGALF